MNKALLTVLKALHYSDKRWMHACDIVEELNSESLCGTLYRHLQQLEGLDLVIIKSKFVNTKNGPMTINFYKISERGVNALSKPEPAVSV